MTEKAKSEPIYGEDVKIDGFIGNGQMGLIIQDAKDKTAKRIVKRVKGFRVDGNDVIFDFFDGLKWRRRRIKASRLLGGCAP